MVLRIEDVTKAIALVDNCVEQTITDTEFSNLVNEFVTKSVDWGSGVKQKLLARTLSRLLLEMQALSSAVAVDAFIDAMNPFVQQRDDEDGDDDAELSDKAESKGGLVFDPLRSALNQLDGALLERLRLSHVILVLRCGGVWLGWVGFGVLRLGWAGLGVSG